MLRLNWHPRLDLTGSVWQTCYGNAEIYLRRRWLDLEHSAWDAFIFSSKQPDGALLGTYLTPCVGMDAISLLIDGYERERRGELACLP